MSRLTKALSAALLLSTAWGAGAAPSVYLLLRANGNDIRGDSKVMTLGREDSIECLAFQSGVTSARDAAGMKTGRDTYAPVTIVKRIDRSSPLLLKALTQNEVCDCEFRFYATTASGQQAEIYRVTLAKAHIISVRQYVPPEGAEGPDLAPATEEVAWVFGDIKWTFVDGGIEHSDSGVAISGGPTDTAAPPAVGGPGRRPTRRAPVLREAQPAQ